MQVVYRIPSGMSVGYLQLMNSPFNIEKQILVLAGNTDEGLGMAGNALLVNELRNQLTGVFAVTNGTQVATANASSQFSAVGTLVPPGQAVVTTPFPASSSAPATLETPGWLLPVLIASGIAVLLIIVLVIVSAFFRRREVAAAQVFHPTNKSNGNSHSHPILRMMNIPVRVQVFLLKCKHRSIGQILLYYFPCSLFMNTLPRLFQELQTPR